MHFAILIRLFNDFDVIVMVQTCEKRVDVHEAPLVKRFSFYREEKLAN